MHRVNILIVDDDEDDFLIIRSLLEDISTGPLNLDWASSYTQGKQLLSENRHSICLMDYQLGTNNGIELLKISQELGFTGPIILLTGIHQGEVDMLALEAGAVDYLVKKNLGAEQLARSIRYALGRREIELERIERLRAEAENRSKSEFLAHLSHELRTPLSAILGFTELLMNTEQNEETYSHIGVVHRNGKHLLGLLNDILDLSKIEAGKLDLSNESIEIMPFLADVYSLMVTATKDKNLQLHFIANSLLPDIIYSDPTRLRQVLLNLIGNAIKFTHVGKIEVLIEMQYTHEKPEISFRIKDSGIGISQENIRSIFEPFVQVKNAQLQTRTGSGLGLTISRQLVKYLGGEIQVSSNEGVGSCFHFYIDPGDIHASNMIPMSLNYAREVRDFLLPQQFTGRILVVDDLRDIRLLIGHYVTRCGIVVEYASNGLEAIEKIEEAKTAGRQFDLLLMDIHMPVKDGITAAKEIRELGYTCPLIALTAAQMKGDAEIYLRAGFSASLSKPVDQAQIVNLLHRYLSPTPSNTLNIDPESGASSIVDKQTEEPVTALSETKQILVVEDSLDVLNAMRNILDLLGWQTCIATNGSNARELVKEFMPEYALVDISLPDTDGYKLSEELSVINPDIRIFLISGSEFDPARSCSAIKGHLLKPISLLQLRSLSNTFN